MLSRDYVRGDSGLHPGVPISIECLYIALDPDVWIHAAAAVVGAGRGLGAGEVVARLLRRDVERATGDDEEEGVVHLLRVLEGVFQLGAILGG